MSQIPENPQPGWFSAGAAILDPATNDPDVYPPLADESAQREWLAGFEAAWWALPEDLTAFEPTATPRGTLVETLSRTLAEHPALLDRLLGLIESAPADTPIDHGSFDRSGHFLSNLMSGRIADGFAGASDGQRAELSPVAVDN